MNDRQKRLMERLLQTFRGEAGDLVRAVTQGLGKLEAGVPGGELAGVVEKVFRDVHSLKGAAHSVGRQEIGRIAGHMEDLLSALRRDEISLSPQILAVLYRGIDATSVRVPGVSVVGAVEDSEGVVADLIRVFAQATADSPTAPPAPHPTPAPAAEEPQTPPAPKSEEPQTPPAPKSDEPAAPAAETPAPVRTTEEIVRLPAGRLDALLRQGEGLLTSVTLSGHVAQRADELDHELKGVLRDQEGVAPLMHRIRVQLADAARSNGDSGAKAELLDYLDGLHRRLAGLSRSLAKQHRSADDHHQSLRRLVDEHVYAIRRTRVVPIGTLLEMVPPMVRETARTLGIEVTLEMTGGDTEVDRLLLDGLRDPLVHLIRNALDHGMEKPGDRIAAGKPERGTLAVTVAQAPDRRIEITISDDGRGIDPDRVAAAAIESGVIAPGDAETLPPAQKVGLVFRSHVTTSPMITELSGRGLGLAIVRERIEDLGGVVTVSSTVGEGTTLRALLPATLATFHAIGLRVGQNYSCIPATAVHRTGRMRRADVRTVENRATIDVGGMAVALVWLADLLEIDADPEPNEWVSFVVAGDADRRVAFAVDEVLEVREVLSKPLGPLLARVRNVVGATILGSGQVISVLSAPDLVASAVRADARSGVEVDEGSGEQHRVLLVEDSITSRMLLKTVLETAGFHVRTAADGLEALEALASEQFDCIVSDVEMPNMNGFSLTTRVREDKDLCDLPVILVTTLEKPRDRELGLEVGANAYIGKSGFDQQVLLDTIARLI
jgi:two-component system, chemotaxis family, sensor kinase CheA